jgi:hypothetical protein
LDRFVLIVIALTLGNLFLAVYNIVDPVNKGTVYVMTPMIDILPEGNPINESEKQRLLSELRYQSEARDMQKAYAYLGSTLSLHDLLRGIEAIDDSQFPLSNSQRNQVVVKLDSVQEKHRELLHIQQELIELEGEISGRVEKLDRSIQ